MKNFNRGGGFSDRKGGGNFARRDSGSRGFRGSDNSSRPDMHKAICADCGASCEVPFKPSGDRPVLCSNCFKGKDGGDSRRSGSRDFSKTSFGDKRLFKAVCADCGQSCEVPFQPSTGKPVFCSNCFGKGDKPRDNKHDHNDNREKTSYNEQFAALNAKLDKIMKALNLNMPQEKVLEKETTKEATKEIKSIKNSEIKKLPKKIAKKSALIKVSPKVKVIKKAKKK